MVASLVEGSMLARYCPGISFGPGKMPAAFMASSVGPLPVLTREEVPEVAYLESPHKSLPEFVNIDARMAVCPEAKALIEELEPGRHQFLAVAIQRQRSRKPILTRSGEPLQKPYYLLRFGVCLDAVWVERSDLMVSQISPGKTLVFPNPGNYGGTVLRRSATAGHHVWKGDRQCPTNLFFSDALTKEVQKRNWKGLDFTHLREE